MPLQLQRHNSNRTGSALDFKHPEINPNSKAFFCVLRSRWNGGSSPMYIQDFGSTFTVIFEDTVPSGKKLTVRVSYFE